MIRLLYSLAHILIRYCGIAALFRYTFARRRISIILYHDPKPGVFEKHLKYLSSEYNLISLVEFTDALNSGNLNSLPKYAIVVTFDDGWKNNYELLPLIKKYKFRPTIFLTSQLLNTERHFWWTICNERDIEHLKQVTNTERLKILKEKYHYYPEKEYKGERQALNTAEINEMKEYVDFGLHTCSHPVLTRCTKEEKTREISGCKTETEKMLGSEMVHFAYPNGDYDTECISILRENNLKFARSIDPGWNRAASDPYRLKVTGVSDDGSLTKLIAELTGIPMYFQYLLNGNCNGLKNNN